MQAEERPTYQELFDLVDEAREIVGHAKFAVDGDNLDLQGYQRVHREEADAFWVAALRGCAATDGAVVAWFAAHFKPWDRSTKEKTAPPFD